MRIKSQFKILVTDENENENEKQWEKDDAKKELFVNLVTLFCIFLILMMPPTIPKNLDETNCIPCPPSACYADQIFQFFTNFITSLF